MTVQKMIQKILLRFNDSDIDQDMVLDMVNDEITEIQSEGNFASEVKDHTIPFIAGTSFKDTSSLDTPVYIKAGGILNVWYGSKSPAYKLAYLSANLREKIDYTTTGTPLYYWQEGNNLVVYPMLDENRDILVEAYTVIDEVSLADEIPLPREHQMTVFYGVARDLCQLFEDFNSKLTYYDDKFEDAKSKLFSTIGTSESYKQFNRRLIDDNPLSYYKLPIA